MTESALIVEVEVAESLVSGFRIRHDPVAARGIPAHITALYPFVDPRDLSADRISAVAGIAAATSAPRFSLVAVDDFPGVLWLRPDPDSPFRALTSALWGRFPEHPPYEGRFPDSQPHLTIAHVDQGSPQAVLRASIEAAIADALPLDATASALSLFVSDADGNWVRRERFPFGPGIPD